MDPEKADERIINEIETLQQFLDNGRSLKNCTLRALDFTGLDIDWRQLEIDNTTFLGCRIDLEDEILLRRRGAFIYVAPSYLPYNPFRRELYSWQELMEGYSEEKDESADRRIYNHFAETRFRPTVNEALWQRIHDHAIDDALRNLLHIGSDGMSRLKCVGFMGGHGRRRDDPFFIKTAECARLLARKGYFIITGGGPGIMEAANFGAYFAGHSEKDFHTALGLLRKGLHFERPGYHQAAIEVLAAYPEGEQSLAIPTWFYGHEPSNLFASHIAKYFSNSLREDHLLAVSLYGIVFAPGSAGTTQEIFMDATQNHYGTFNYYSPMVFLGKERYEIETLIFPLLKQLAWGKEYYDLLFISDEPEEILDFLVHHPPVPLG